MHVRLGRLFLVYFRRVVHSLLLALPDPPAGAAVPADFRMSATIAQLGELGGPGFR